MSAITTFLQSEQALKILGLPGLALLLAFAFYRMLVAGKLVRPIGRNQSFIVLIMIILYFLVVSVLLIWVYRPERGAVAAPATNLQKPSGEEQSSWSKVDSFLDRAEMATPLATFDAAFGPASSDSAIDPETTQLRKRSYDKPDDGLLVTVGHDDRSVQWIAAIDDGKKLRIPTLGSDRLSDYDLEYLAKICQAKLVTPGYGGYFAITPCYFARGGSYNFFAFIFAVGGQNSPFGGSCSAIMLDDVPFTVERVRQCQAGKEKPVGFIVTREEGLLPKAVESLVETLEN